MLTRMAQESGIETPTAEDLARFERKRKGKTQSNADWKSPTDPDARYAEMMGGTKQLTYKLEHAVSSVKASSMPSVDRPRAKLERQTLGFLRSPRKRCAARTLDTNRSGQSSSRVRPGADILRRDVQTGRHCGVGIGPSFICIHYSRNWGRPTNMSRRYRSGKP